MCGAILGACGLHVTGMWVACDSHFYACGLRVTGIWVHVSCMWYDWVSFALILASAFRKLPSECTF